MVVFGGTAFVRFLEHLLDRKGIKSASMEAAANTSVP